MKGVVLAEVAEVFNGKTPSKDEQREQGHPVLKIKDVDEDGHFKGFFDSFVDGDLASKFSAKQIRLDDSLILNAAHNSDYVGSKQYRAEHAVVGALPTGEWLIARADTEQLHPRFLNYWLRSPQARFQIKRMVKGIHLYPKDVMRLEIPLPPLPEQKRIAAILDKADSIRRKRQQAIQLADDFLRAVFLDMFGDPVTNPKGWIVKPVGEICDCIVPGRDKPKSFTGSTPWITTNELNHLGVTTKKLDFIGLSKEEIVEVRAKVVPAGSIIMTCVGDLGVVSVAGEDMVINQQLHAFLPNDVVEPSFLCFALAAQERYMVRMASSTTVPYMNKAICNSVPVIVPPKNVQEKFEKVFSKIKKTRGVMAEHYDAKLYETISQMVFLTKNTC